MDPFLCKKIKKNQSFIKSRNRTHSNAITIKQILILRTFDEVIRTRPSTTRRDRDWLFIADGIRQLLNELSDPMGLGPTRRDPIRSAGKEREPIRRGSAHHYPVHRVLQLLRKRIRLRLRLRRGDIDLNQLPEVRAAIRGLRSEEDGSRWREEISRGESAPGERKRRRRRSSHCRERD